MRVDKVRMEKEKVEATYHDTPFPHVIIDNFYNQEELELIWQELDFYTPVSYTHLTLPTICSV